MERPITIDPAKIMAKIRWHEQESKQLHALLDQLDSLREFSVESPSKNGRGRPSKDNPMVDVLRKFVEAQNGDFNHKQIKAAVGNPARRDRLRSAIKTLQSDGVLDVVEKPNGRFQGLYRRKAKA